MLQVYRPLIGGGEPNDIADIVGFLSSSDSRWITGELIDASGGSCL